MTDINDYQALLMALKAVDSQPSMAKEFLFANLTTIYQALTIASKITEQAYTATFDPREPFKITLDQDFIPPTQEEINKLLTGE